MTGLAAHKRVNGRRAEISVNTSGRIMVQGGRVEALTCSADTSGSIHFRGSAGEVELEAGTNGRIHVEEVTGDCEKTQGTGGRITGRLPVRAELRGR